MKKVYIVGESHYVTDYFKMYYEKGYKPVLTMEEADIVQFTGGSDVSPNLYHEGPHPHTYFDNKRDIQEMKEYVKALNSNKYMVGICRGGQFLNVMNQGKMYQDVNNHAISGTHIAIDQETGRDIKVTSTHHQMMRKGTNAIIVAYAQNLSTYKEHIDRGCIMRVTEDNVDLEVLWYSDTKCLCFQPHPEIPTGKRECRDYFFELLNRYINVEDTKCVV